MNTPKPTKPNDEEIDKIIEDVYQMGITDRVLGTNDFKELRPGIRKKLEALITKREHLAREEGYKKGYLDCGVANIVNTEKARQAVENELQQQLEEAKSE